MTLDSAVLLYTYISRFSVNPHHQQMRKIWQSCCHKFYPPAVPHCVFQLLSQMAHVRFHRRKWVYSLAFANRTAHNGPHVETGAFRTGRCHYPRSVPHVRKPPRVGYQNGVRCRFWVLVGSAPEERRKPSEQRCAYARRCSEGVAAPLGCKNSIT